MTVQKQSQGKRVADASYYYLWHLAALNIIQADFGNGAAAASAPDVLGTQWESIEGVDGKGTEPARVALIDVGVDDQHPNLKSRIDSSNSIDLTTTRYGAKRPAPGTPTSIDYRDSRFFADLGSKRPVPDLDLDTDAKAHFEALVGDLAASTGEFRPRDNSFDTHGTAVAGLIVGEPAAVAGYDSKQLTPEAAFAGAKDTTARVHSNPDAQVLPYFGVDPFSALLSIKTSFEDEPHQFIEAFLYAWLMDVDVVVLPRGIPDPVRSHLSPKKELLLRQGGFAGRYASDLIGRLEPNERLTALFSDLAETDDEVDVEQFNAALQGSADPRKPQRRASAEIEWGILKQLIIGISRHIPIICAAGNSGESQLIYPANLAADSNGIIAVGAVTSEGIRSSYSNYGRNLTLVAPSDDAEVFNRHQLRIDRLSPFAQDHTFAATSGEELPYSQLELATTDLPGVFGYEEGLASAFAVGPQAQGTNSGSYTSFGGTSGAAALAGGVAALVQRAYRAALGKIGRLNGTEMKGLLKDACGDHIPAPVRLELRPDSMSSPEEDKAYFFGAGLLNAEKALEIAREKALDASEATA